MQYKEVPASGTLKPFVKYFWKYEHAFEDTEYTILPDACFDMVVDFEYDVLQNIYLTGLWTKPVNVTVTKGTTLLAVRFKIIAAECLFKREVKSILNSMTVLPKEYWSINLAKSTEFEKFSSDLSDLMTSILKQQRPIDDRKLKLFNYIYNEEVQNVRELSEKVVWSSRQINRYFHKQFGVSLKTLLNIVRCNAAYPHIVEGRLYPEKEYTDQAHYIKEVRKYTDNSPGQLYKNENDRFLQLSAFKMK
jgi:AraC-like DNA-binding protein